MNTIPAKIDFIESHQPTLESGEYRISIQQTLDDTGLKIPEQTYESQKTFYVAGERFHILPKHIGGVFPPANSLGEHSHVLPHIMLSRTTLPWEREAIRGDVKTPSVRLLLIHEDETADTKVSVVRLSDLETASDSTPYFPGITLEPGQNGADNVTVLDIKKSLLERILPGPQALNFLSHVRQGKDDSTPPRIVGEELAVLIANRLPQKGAVNTVHLVSFENRYNSGLFNYQTAGNDDMVRLIKLFSWSFTSTKHFKISKEHITHAVNSFKLRKKMIDKLSVNQTIKNSLKNDTNGILIDKEFNTEYDFTEALTLLLGIPSNNDRQEILYHAHLSTTITNILQQELIGEEFFTEEKFEERLNEVFINTLQELVDHKDKIYEEFTYGDFAGVLKHLNRETTTLRLPDVGNTNSNKYLEMGFYPLPHQLRQGGQTVSWYHGPLAPRSNTEAFAFPARSSDALLRYYEANGMFDVSYAAAWELGRLLALQNTHFSTELYRWKRRYAKLLRHTEQRVLHGTTHLRGANRDATPESLPESLRNWFKDLHCLKGIPFQYLIPDEALLPVESIRFFQLDKLWMEALFDGAFGIGRVTTKDHELDTLIAQEELNLVKDQVSGFILRSEVVSGWPGLQLEGYQVVPQGSNEAIIADVEKIPLMYRTRLSDNVMLCLFEGDLQTLDMHLKPEVLHFGFNPKTGGGYEKELRDNNGQEQAAYTVDVPLAADRVLDLDGFLSNIRVHQANISWPLEATSESSADLALQLLEGVEKVRFIKSI